MTHYRLTTGPGHKLANCELIEKGSSMTKTVEALGYTWRISDGRQARESGTNVRNVAYLDPIDPETGDRLSHVTIRGRERYAGVLSVIEWRRQDRGYVNKGLSELTDSNVAALAEVALPVALAEFPPLTHAEKIARVKTGAKTVGSNAASEAWRNLIAWQDDLRAELTPEDIAELAAELAAGFVERIARGH